MTNDDHEMLAWVVDRPGPIASRPLVAVRATASGARAG